MEMKIFFTILACLITLVSSKAVILDNENFNALTSNGFWFVDFYTQWCGHCKTLAPVWEQLSVKMGTVVNIAKIDCGQDNTARTCQHLGVYGYPTLKMFYNGQHITNYDGHRSLDILMNYCNDIVRKFTPPPPPEPEEPDEETINQEEEEEEDDDDNDEENQENQPENQVEIQEEKQPEIPRKEGKEPLKQENQGENQENKVEKKKRERREEFPRFISDPNGEVVILNSENFNRLTQVGFWFIEYFAPWCGHCKKLSPVWDSLAKALRGRVNVGKVDCTAESAICDRFGIRGYPTLKFLVDGHVHDYREERKLETLVGFAKRVSGESIRDIDAQEFEKLRKEKEVFFMFLYLGDDEADYELIEDVGRKHIVSMEFYQSEDKSILINNQISGVDLGRPILLVSRNGDLAVYKGDPKSIPAIEKWIDEHKVPFFAELDSAFAIDVFQSQQLAVVLIDDSKKDSFQLHAKIEIERAALQYNKELLMGIHPNPVFFSFLDIGKYQNYASKQYGVNSDDCPKIIILHPATNTYYDELPNTEKVKIDQNAILHFLKIVEKGDASGKSIGGIVQGIIFSLQKMLAPLMEFVVANLFLVLGGVLIGTIALVWWIISDPIPLKAGKEE